MVNKLGYPFRNEANGTLEQNRVILNCLSMQLEQDKQALAVQWMYKTLKLFVIKNAMPNLKANQMFV